MMESIDNETKQYGFTDISFDKLSTNELLALLDKLPHGYRTVFNMFAIEGFSHREIANSLGIDEGTSRSQLAKARKALQDLITNNEKIRL